MTGPLVVTSLVEGYGEVEALPVLLRRIIEVIAPEKWVDVQRPVRVSRGTMLKKGEFERYLEFAIRQHQGNGVTLVLLDADDDCAAELGLELRKRAEAHRPGALVGVVAAVKEFEAWFLAGARSLAGKRGLPLGLEPPAEPEGVRDAKGWLQLRRTDGLAYGPTVDQPALAAVVDLAAARTGAPSFDKLWREVQRLIVGRPGAHL